MKYLSLLVLLTISACGSMPSWDQMKANRAAYVKKHPSRNVATTTCSQQWNKLVCNTESN